MRRRTVRTGLHLIIMAVVLVILAAFYHDQLALFLSLSPARETMFTYLGLMWGGIFGFCGITVTVIGLLRSPGGEPRPGLMKPVIILALLVLLFICLFFSSFNRPEYPRLRPGDTITI
jgi:Na+-driven multidrug efflux pump